MDSSLPSRQLTQLSADRAASAGGGARTAACLALVAAAVSVGVYRKVLDAYFWNDDFVWMYMLRDMRLSEVLFTPEGGHSCVARNAVFALVQALAGIDPRPYFATVLVTHAVNVVLLCRLIWLLTGSAGLAGLGALAWGICPTASETLAWYSVYGQIAALTCLLCAFCHLAARTRRADVLAPRDLVVVGAWLALASLFFGTAIAVTLVLPVVVVLLLPDMRASHRRMQSVLTVSGLVLVLYATLQVLGMWLYAAPAVHVDALRWLAHGTDLAFFSFVHLIRVGVTSLVLGPWWSPAGHADLTSWATLLVVAIALITAIRIASTKARAQVLAFTLLGLANYALVAVSRGPMAGFFHQTSTDIGATLRYHYTAQAFLVVAFCTVLEVLAGRLHSGAQAVFAAGCAGLLVAGQLVHGNSFDLHEASRSEVTDAMVRLRDRVAAARPGDTVYVDNQPLAAFGWMPNIPVPLPGLAALVVIVSPSDELDGRRIRFVERNPAVYRRFGSRRGSRLAGLMVPEQPSERTE